MIQEKDNEQIQSHSVLFFQDKLYDMVTFLSFLTNNMRIFFFDEKLIYYIVVVMCRINKRILFSF